MADGDEPQATILLMPLPMKQKTAPLGTVFSHAVGSSSADSIGFGGSVFRR